MTISRASCCMTASSASRKVAACGVSGRISTPERPFAMAMTVSFVLMSPSMVIRLNDCATFSSIMSESSAFEIFTSVVM